MRAEFERRKIQDLEEYRQSRMLNNAKASPKKQEPKMDVGFQREEIAEQKAKKEEDRYFRERQPEEIKASRKPFENESKKVDMDIFGNKKFDRITTNRSRRIQNKRK